MIIYDYIWLYMKHMIYIYIRIYILYIYYIYINVRILYHPQYIGHIYITVCDFYGICDSLWRLKQTGMHTLQFLSIFDG